MYFHYPRFCKKPQLPLGNIHTSPLHMLPPITQLLPDVPIVYDDDAHIPGLTTTTSSSSSRAPWVWLACCGAFFLVSVKERRVFASDTLTALVAYFLRTTGRSFQAASHDTDGMQQPYQSNSSSMNKAYIKGEACAPHAHIQMLNS